jgi:hypothetical protein
MAVLVGVAGALVGLILKVGGFVGSGFGGSLVGEGSTSTLATTLASGDGVSAVWVPPPQATSTNTNAAGRKSDIVSLEFIFPTFGCT